MEEGYIYDTVLQLETIKKTSAQSAVAVEYEDCISARGKTSPSSDLWTRRQGL